MAWESYKNVFLEKRVGSAINAQICFFMLYLKKGRDYRHAMVIKIVHVFKLIRDKIKQCFDCLPFLWLSNSQEHNNERIAVSYPRNTGKIYSYFSSLSFVAPICPQYWGSIKEMSTGFHSNFHQIWWKWHSKKSKVNQEDWDVV